MFNFGLFLLLLETFQIYFSTTALPQGWDDLVGHDIFLQRNYLKALEMASPDNVQFFYVGVFSESTLVGVAIVQRVQLYLQDMFRKTKVSCLKELIKSTVSKVLKGNVLVVGNLTHTGQHGVFFKKEKITQTDFLNLVFESLEVLKIAIKKSQNKTIRVVMFKDYFLDDAIHQESKLFNNHKLHKVVVQPNMVMAVRNDWQTTTDYVSSLTKKYKSRYKRAKKKLGKITSKELNSEDIQENAKALHNLYLNVSDNAKFNTFILPENHFYILKTHLKDNFKVFGYFLDNELVGFYTLILNSNTLETYFLGYDSEHQYSNQLYLNMLYDMASFAIDNTFLSVIYARTAMEIKSSVGAESKTMFVYMKHTNGVLNAILKPIFGLMRPEQSWTKRNPFKEVKSP